MVALSGGVDSSVAALLLKKKGYQVTGVFMKNWSDPLTPGGERCPWRQDLFDARKVAAHLDIPLRVVSFEKEYKQKVFKYFLSEYQKGRTPNPDIMCNKEIKFKALFKEASKLRINFVATGHYARIQKRGDQYYLLKGIDKNKDQSYFIYNLNQTQLKKLIFPVGGYTKNQVRNLAKRFNLHTFKKKDSQGICFIGPNNFRQFLKQYFQDKPGKIIDQKGNYLGKHPGIFYYTIGQRENLGLGGPGGPYFVLKINARTNTLIVTNNERDLLQDKLTAQKLHWILGKNPKLPLNVSAKIRYRSKDAKCIIKKSKGKISVRFQKPQRAITSGQSLVFYKGEQVLGGGIID